MATAYVTPIVTRPYGPDEERGHERNAEPKKKR